MILGQLVIMVFGMINDLWSFAILFVTTILGYGIAFYSLFPHSEQRSFSSLSQTFLTLFDAALGNHDFGEFSENKLHEAMGITLMVLYITLVMIVLLNLVIARMSATHEKIDNSALEIWSKIQAINVEQFVLIFERNPLCMLPPPFNLITITAGIIVAWRRMVSDKKKGSVRHVVVERFKYLMQILSKLFPKVRVFRNISNNLDDKEGKKEKSTTKSVKVVTNDDDELTVKNGGSKAPPTRRLTKRGSTRSSRSVSPTLSVEESDDDDLRASDQDNIIISIAGTVSDKVSR
jgi:hypothetical protein